MIVICGKGQVDSLGYFYLTQKAELMTKPSNELRKI